MPYSNTPHDDSPWLPNPSASHTVSSALADYTVLADAESAEVGLLVEDAWQHNGLGRVLFEHLLVLGERRGIRSFVAYVHWSNRRVIHALGRIATIVNCAFEAPVLKFTFTRQHEVGGGPTVVQWILQRLDAEV